MSSGGGGVEGGGGGGGVEGGGGRLEEKGMRIGRLEGKKQKQTQVFSFCHPDPIFVEKNDVSF